MCHKKWENDDSLRNERDGKGGGKCKGEGKERGKGGMVGSMRMEKEHESEERK